MGKGFSKQKVVRDRRLSSTHTPCTSLDPKILERGDLFGETERKGRYAEPLKMAQELVMDLIPLKDPGHLKYQNWKLSLRTMGMGRGRREGGRGRGAKLHSATLYPLIANTNPNLFTIYSLDRIWSSIPAYSILG